MSIPTTTTNFRKCSDHFQVCLKNIYYQYQPLQSTSTLVVWYTFDLFDPSTHRTASLQPQIIGNWQYVGKERYEIRSKKLASAALFMPGKDETLRFCTDHTKLGTVTTCGSYPILRIEEIMESLKINQAFSVLNAGADYWKFENKNLTRKSRHSPSPADVVNLHEWDIVILKSKFIFWF